MPSIPANFLGHTGPKNPLSHEKLLRVCHAYQRLFSRYLAAGGQIDSELYETTLDIEREIAYWATRASKLRYNARKQRDQRAQRRALAHSENEHSPHYDSTTDTFTDDPNESYRADIPTATLEALARFRRGEGTRVAADEQLGPDTSDYRKSGLV